MSPPVNGNMAHKRRIVLDARDRDRRRAERHRYGILRNLVVSKITLRRYETGVWEFFRWLEEEGRDIPFDLCQLDEELALYIEYLWGTGEPRSYASHTLCGIQHLCPQVKRHIPESWRLYGAWYRHEEPARAWPFDVLEAKALCQVALDGGDHPLAFLFWLGFICYLRPAEGVLRTFNDFTFSDDGKALLIDLGFTKSGKRRGEKEQIICRDPYALVLFAYLQEGRRPEEPIFPEGMGAYRYRFNVYLASLGLGIFPYKPYSLRRGGATYAFTQSLNYHILMSTGRWANLRTVKLYVDEARILLANRAFSDTLKATILRFAQTLDHLFT